MPARNDHWKRYGKLEENLGYRFQDQSLLQRALTHSSWMNEASKDDQVGRLDNTRLAFLGDAVLRLAVSQLLYGQVPMKAIGALSQERDQHVNNATIAKHGATRLDLDSVLAKGSGEESDSRPQAVTTRTATAFEAVIAAVYLDSGGDVHRTAEVVHRILDF